MTSVTHVAEVGTDERGQVLRIIQRVAAAEPGLLGQLGERHEPLGPARVAQAAVADGHRKAVDRQPSRTADRAGQPVIAAGHQARQVLAVAAEQLVGAHPGQDHLDPALARRLAHQHGVDRRRVADRLVEDVHHARQQVHDVRGDLDLVQVDAEPLGDLARVDRVVRHRLELLVLRPEGDRVRVDRAGVLVGEDRDDAGVEAAGQEARHRDIGHQVRPDRFLDHGPQVRGGLACGRRGSVLNPPVLPDLGLGARADPRPGAGRELVHALDRAALLGDPVIEHGRDQRTRLDPQLGAERRQDRLELGGEHDAVAALGVEERLDAKRVAGQH